MAESQLPFTYEVGTQAGLKKSLTEARLGRYMKQAGFDFSRAMRLYLWNARLSKAFQFPLHILEVTLRNAVVEHLVAGGAPPEWAFDDAYLNKLAAANAGTRDSLNKCKARLLQKKLGGQSDIMLASAPQNIPSFNAIGTNDVVASLSFEFWAVLLGSSFERDWQLSLRKTFPHADSKTSRRDIWLAVMALKEFRNRVAHHEPIFHLADLAARHSQILGLVGMRCELTKNWVQHYSTVPAAIRQAGDDTSVNDRVLLKARKVTAVDSADLPLRDVLPMLKTRKSDLVLIQDDAGLRLVSPHDIVSWLIASMPQELADLTLPLRSVLEGIPTADRVQIVESQTTVAEAGRHFYARNTPTNKKPTALLVTEDGTATGVPWARRIVLDGYLFDYDVLDGTAWIQNVRSSVNTPRVTLDDDVDCEAPSDPPTGDTFAKK